MSKKLHFAQLHCVKAAGKAMQNTGMLRPHARVGVAVSGGMDSWVLLQVLCIRQRIVPFPFEIMALHVNPGFDPQSHLPLLEWLDANGVAGHVEVTDHGPRAHTEENRTKSPCFFCARLRRKRLFELCQEHGLTHLAFGHNADDLVHTFFMNLWQNGRVDGMSMSESFFGGVLEVIRPLLLVHKTEIAKAVRQWGLPVWQNPCPSAGKTKRAEIQSELEALFSRNKLMRANTFNGLCTWQLRKNSIDALTMHQQQRYTKENTKNACELLQSKDSQRREE